jgi:hypothetical protein
MIVVACDRRSGILERAGRLAQHHRYRPAIFTEHGQQQGSRVAMADVFYHWYASEDCLQRFCMTNLATIWIALTIASPSSAKKLPQHDLESVRLLPDGTPYDCRTPEVLMRD